MDWTSERYGRGMIAVLAAALAVRLVVFVIPVLIEGDLKSAYHSDSTSYLIPARELLETGGFADAGIPEIVRTPGYPIFLIPGILIGHVEIVTIVAQILLSCGTVFMVHHLVLLVASDKRPALAAAALYALEPLSLIYSAKLLTETVFTFVLVVAIYLLGLYVRNRSFWPIVVAGSGLAICAFVRPISYYLCGFLTVVLAAWAITRFPNRRTAVQIAAFSLVGTIPLLAWQARNQWIAGYAGFSAISVANLFYFEAASVVARRENLPLDAVQRRIGYFDADFHADRRLLNRGATQGAYFRNMRREALSTILEHPITFVWIRVTGSLKTLTNPGGIEFVKHFDASSSIRGERFGVIREDHAATIVSFLTERPAVFWTNILLAGFLGGCLVFFGVAVAMRRVRSAGPSLVLLSVAFYLFVISGGGVACSRFRHPIMPIIAVYAGIGLVAASDRLRVVRDRKANHDRDR